MVADGRRINEFFILIMIGFFSHIISRALSQTKAVICIWLVQLILGIAFAVCVYDQLDMALGNSASLEVLAKGFDRSVFSDMVNEYPLMAGHIQFRFVIFLLAYFILMILLQGGLIVNIRKQQYSLKGLWKNAVNHFGRFFILALISIILLALCSAIIIVPFQMITNPPLEVFDTEKTYIWSIIAALSVIVIIAVLIWSWSVITRLFIADGQVLKSAMRNSLSTVWRHKGKFLGWGLFLVGIHLLLFIIYPYIISDWGAGTWFCVVSLIMIQQVFSLIRLSLRVVAYCGIERIENQ